MKNKIIKIGWSKMLVFSIGMSVACVSMFGPVCANLNKQSFFTEPKLGYGPEPRFQGLGDLPGGVNNSWARGVSADGSVVVGISTISEPGYESFEAFRWTAEEGMVGLGDLPGGSFNSMAFGISADGQVIVGRSNSDTQWEDCVEAFRWTADEGMVGLGFLESYDIVSVASAASDDGSVIVGFSKNPSPFHGPQHRDAFIWTESDGMSYIAHHPELSNSGASGLSADGSTVVGQGMVYGSRFQGFSWTETEGVVGLGWLPEDNPDFALSAAHAVSADGSAISGFSGLPIPHHPKYEACIWTSDEIIGLGDFPGGDFHSKALGISADGTIAVGHGWTDAGKEAFIWDAENGLRNLRDVLIDFGLDLTGWKLKEATDISADGQTIVGDGINSNGDNEGWIAVVPHENRPCLEIGEISGGLGVNAVVKNLGDGDATNVQITVTIEDGLIIFTRDYNETLGSLSDGGSAEISMPVFGIGLGIITEMPTITVTAECDEGSSDQDSVNAKIFLRRVTIQ